MPVSRLRAVCWLLQLERPLWSTPEFVRNRSGCVSRQSHRANVNCGMQPRSPSQIHRELPWRRRERERLTRLRVSADSLGHLLCGQVCDEGIAKLALAQLNMTVKTFGSKVVGYLNGAHPEDLVSFGPFCARVVLENGCAALVARIDPFRILYLTEFQAQKEYVLDKRAKTAFSWAGDVIPDSKSTNLWDIDHDLPKISRALFSNHMDHLYWKPAIENAVDFISSYPPEPFLTDILSADPEKFIASSRGSSSQLYSTLSKGVHWEFFNSLLSLDELTVKLTIKEACVTMAKLGLISHFIPTAYACLEKKRAVEAYIEFRRVIS